MFKTSMFSQALPSFEQFVAKITCDARSLNMLCLNMVDNVEFVGGYLIAPGANPTQDWISVHILRDK